MRTMSSTLSGGFMALLLLAASNLVIAQDGDIEREFDVQPGGMLDIRSDAGSIEVQSWNEERVRVRVINPDAFDVSIEQSGNEVRVVAEDDRGRSRIRFEAWVPTEFNVNLDTGGGSIDVDGLTGNVTADTSGGSIRIGRIQDGDVRVDTSGGMIDIEDVTNGNVFADTSGGRITIGNVSGDVSADTSGGMITIGNVDGSIDADTSGGSIQVGTSTSNVTLETSGGSIRAEYARGRMNVDTSGGNITLEGSDGLLIADTSGGTIRVTRSGGPVEVNTSGGNIFLGPINGYIEADTSGGSIEAELGEVAADQDSHIYLESSGGDIELTLPANHRATITASIEVSRRSRGDYRIYTDFPLTITGQDEREVQGRGDINGGGDRIRLETNNGDIRIRSRAD